MRKKTKWQISAVVFSKKQIFSPVLKSPTHAGFIGVKKFGQKYHTWAPLSYSFSPCTCIFKYD
jgi:hypothetical protein